MPVKVLQRDSNELNLGLLEKATQVFNSSEADWMHMIPLSTLTTSLVT